MLSVKAAEGALLQVARGLLSGYVSCWSSLAPLLAARLMFYGCRLIYSTAAGACAGDGAPLNTAHLLGQDQDSAPRSRTVSETGPALQRRQEDGCLHCAVGLSKTAQLTLKPDEHRQSPVACSTPLISSQLVQCS